MSWWAAAFQALGSALSSSSSSRQSRRQQQQANEQRMRELGMQYGTMRDLAAWERDLAAWERGNQLEDRRYREEAMGNYGQFSTLQGVERVPYSSTTPTPIPDSTAAVTASLLAKPKPKPKAGLLRN